MITEKLVTRQLMNEIILYEYNKMNLMKQNSLN